MTKALADNNINNTNSNNTNGNNNNNDDDDDDDDDGDGGDDDGGDAQDGGNVNDNGNGYDGGNGNDDGNGHCDGNGTGRNENCNENVTDDTDRNDEESDTPSSLSSKSKTASSTSKEKKTMDSNRSRNSVSDNENKRKLPMLCSSSSSSSEQNQDKVQKMAKNSNAAPSDGDVAAAAATFATAMALQQQQQLLVSVPDAKRSKMNQQQQHQTQLQKQLQYLQSHREQPQQQQTAIVVASSSSSATVSSRTPLSLPITATAKPSLTRTATAPARTAMETTPSKATMAAASTTKRVNNEQWDAMFERLLLYKQLHGDCLVPKRYGIDPKLGTWVETQRVQYKRLERTVDIQSGMEIVIPSKRLNQHRLEKLKSIDFVWSAKKNNSTHSSKPIKASAAMSRSSSSSINKENMKLPPPATTAVRLATPEAVITETTTTTESTIHNDGGKQHQIQQHNNNSSSYGNDDRSIGNTPSNAPEANIPAGVDNDNDSTKNNNKVAATKSRLNNAQWEEMFLRLKNYKEKYGDCLVPRKYDEDPKLGAWVETQRVLWNREFKNTETTTTNGDLNTPSTADHYLSSSSAHEQRQQRPPQSMVSQPSPSLFSTDMREVVPLSSHRHAAIIGRTTEDDVGISSQDGNSRRGSLICDGVVDRSRGLEEDKEVHVISAIGHRSSPDNPLVASTREEQQGQRQRRLSADSYPVKEVYFANADISVHAPLRRSDDAMTSARSDNNEDIIRRSLMSGRTDVTMGSSNAAYAYPTPRDGTEMSEENTVVSINAGDISNTANVATNTSLEGKKTAYDITKVVALGDEVIGASISGNRQFPIMASKSPTPTTSGDEEGGGIEGLANQKTVATMGPREQQHLQHELQYQNLMDLSATSANKRSSDAGSIEAGMPVSEPSPNQPIVNKRLTEERKAKLDSLGFVWSLRTKRIDDHWDEMFQQLIEYKKKFNDCLVPSRFEENLKLGKWVETQRYEYTKLQRALDQYERDSLTNGGDSSSINSRHPGRPTNSRLTEDRLRRLESIGFEWKVRHKMKRYYDRQWNTMFQRLLKFKEANGHCMVPKRYPPDIKLGTWVHTQRIQYRKLMSDETPIIESMKSEEEASFRLTVERKKKLEDAGFVWSARESEKDNDRARRTRTSYDDQWDVMFNRLVEYKKQNGHCLVPKRFKPDPKLGTWVDTQRVQYKKKLAFQEREFSESQNNKDANGDDDDNSVSILSSNSVVGRLTNDRIHRLEALGFVWSLRDSWQKHYEELKEFKNEHGHCNVPARYTKNRRLGIWVSAQRQHYKTLNTPADESKPRRAAPLTPERIKALDKLGFTWTIRSRDTLGESWNQRFEELKQYKATHGHCCVPSRYPPNPELGIWVGTQRTQYRLFMEMKETGTQDPTVSSMNDERIKLLGQLGFVWTLRKNDKKNSALLSGERAADGAMDYDVLEAPNDTASCASDFDDETDNVDDSTTAIRNNYIVRKSIDHAEI